MINLDTFLYYALFSSAVLIYGIGLNRISELGVTKLYSVIFYIKAVFTILITSVLTWLVTSRILVPLKLVEIFPVLCFLIFVCINSFIEALIRLTTGISTSEFIVSFLIVLLSIMESVSIINSIIICVSCFVAFLILIPLCYAFKYRFCSNGNTINEKYYCTFLFFIAVLVMLISGFDISWLSFGAIQ